MIQVNELRIGNWISLYGQYTTVYSISEPYNCFNGDVYDGSWPSLDDAVGIPITSEILEKCGFIQSQSIEAAMVSQGDNGASIWCLVRDHHISVTIDVYGNRCLLGHIQYLHQLQNLYFALTGKELTVNL